MPEPLLIAAVMLLAAALFAGRSGTGNYLRFAAILCAALAVALLSPLEGLAVAAAMFALPLVGVALGLSALARMRRPAPALVASLALAAALACGLGAIFTATVTPVIAPLALGGVVMMISARPVLMLSGVLLLAAASAGLGEGLGAGLVSLLAAALLGAGLYSRVSRTAPSLVPAAL